MRPNSPKSVVVSARRPRPLPAPLIDALLAVSATLGLSSAARAQEATSPPPVALSAETYQLGHSPLNEPAALAKIPEAEPAHFLIPVGTGGLNFDAGLKLVYVDNVFLTQNHPSDDFVIVPECDISALFPVGQFNALHFDIGLGYYEYLKNTQLNSGVPLINPNTDLSFTLRSGDFRVKFSEKFSYQESPVYDTGGEFFNLFNTALFKRYFNRVGALVTWDQNQLVMTAGYFHENLWSANSVFNYVDHASELFSTDAMLATSKAITVGLEAAGSLNSFPNSPSYDTWRARVGPVLKFTPSEFISVRVGGGYERIQYDSSAAASLGLKPENTYYAYGDVEHTINQFLHQALTVAHDNQLGFNAANLEGTTLSYSITWAPRPRLSITPLASVNFYNESFGSTTANLYHEEFTYYLFGLSAQYQLGHHWRTDAGWNYRLKDSEIESHGYSQNQAFIEVVYQF